MKKSNSTLWTLTESVKAVKIFLLLTVTGHSTSRSFAMVEIVPHPFAKVDCDKDGGGVANDSNFGEFDRLLVKVGEVRDSC